MQYCIKPLNHYIIKQLNRILNWIDKEMNFNVWYNVNSKEQKQAIIILMDTDFIPDCEFNSDYTKFRKSRLAFDLFILNKK